MDRPRVFLICVNRLVCEAVNAVLRREGIDLLGIETDPESGLAQVRALDPDIVLVEGDGAKIETTLMSELARLTYEREKLQVIRLSLPNEVLHIYHQEQRRFIDTHDLVSAIRFSVQA
jgi:DNA-binding NarL/FixJ family response regulator